MKEQQKTNFLAFPLRVIVSPFKAFRDIVQNPDIKGVVLVAGLVILATAGAYYTYSSKVFFNITDTTETSLLASNMFSDYIVTNLTQTALFFVFNWLIYAGVLLLVMRALGEKEGSWRSFFVLMGYAFSITIIQWVVGAFLIATLPEVHLGLTSWPPNQEDAVKVATKFNDTWGSTVTYRALTYLTFPFFNVIDVWLVVLSVIAVRAFTQTTWGKAVAISLTAFIVRFLLRYFFGF